MKKKGIAIIVGLLTGMIVYAQKPADKKAASPTPPAKLKNLSDTVQYAIGSYLAQWVNENGFAITNANIFLRAMDDVFRDKPRMVADSLAGPIVSGMQRITQKDIGLKTEQKMFESLKDKQGMGMLPNGVRYFVITAGEGAHPSKKDSVIVNVKGTLPNGAIFEDSYQKGKSILTPVAAMIPGLAESLPMMSEGSKWKFYIPSSLAYGEKGTAIIPANAALIIELELVKVRSFK